MKIRKNDNVVILKGKDRGKTGRVIAVFPKTSKIMVEGLNVYKKHAKPSKKYPQGGIMDVNVPVSSDNLQIICPNCSKATRVSFKNSGRDKRRICRKCNEVVDATV
jgi:large subunit ribosomal protein L24